MSSVHRRYTPSLPPIPEDRCVDYEENTVALASRIFNYNVQRTTTSNNRIINSINLNDITNGFFGSLPTEVKRAIEAEVKECLRQTSKQDYPEANILEYLKLSICNKLIKFITKEESSLETFFSEIKHISCRSERIAIIDNINNKIVYFLINKKDFMPEFIFKRLKYTALCASVRNLFQKYTIRIEEIDRDFVSNGVFLIKQIIELLSEESIKISSKKTELDRDEVLEQLKGATSSLKTNKNATPANLTELKSSLMNDSESRLIEIFCLLKSYGDDKYFEEFYQFADLIYEIELYISEIFGWEKNKT